MGVTVEKVSDVTPELASGLASLIPHLNESAPILDVDAFRAIVTQPGVHLLVARDGEARVVGTVTVVCFRIPSGRRARIESLVVAPTARREGVGRALCEAALECAQGHGAETVDLTSGPARMEANALYRSLGFTPRATNTYRMRIGDGHPAVAAEPGVAAVDHLGRFASSVARR